jgi:hypothetical protein
LPIKSVMLVTLEYPNGRTHQATIDEDDLEPGDEFDLYGRRWVVEHVPRRRAYSEAGSRVLCRSTSESPLARDK